MRKNNSRGTKKPGSRKTKSPSSKRNLSASAQVRLTLQKSASAVVSASDEAGTLGGVLKELSRLPLQEIVVVLNGCRDNSYEIARKFPAVTIVHEPDRVGHDVGRAIGAELTTSDIVLFTDGDIVIKAEQLAPFLTAVDRGVDMALNNLTSYIPAFPDQDDVTRMKAYLNSVLNRSDLAANSLVAVPHALSSRCIREIGYQSLMVPPLAQMLACTKGMKVEAVSKVNVITGNRLRKDNTGKGNNVERMIIGDHIEALSKYLEAGPGLEEYSSDSQYRAAVASWRNAP
ncbi:MULTISPECIES: glycosyltransferase [unclassified Paenibacillus]|uniref:Glucosyl-3-phosphoglycerate synthase n=1 Tax=Paenibacillus provencensis TaxID=441151 RepID=A0ABW3PWV1_9BACL|nr:MULTISPECIES: glycosyltransferase [unclassified Paenibacillus]MCM3129853.1 glycosyltransferase [Paenibacillus sp. MER 78]SFS91482.1 Glycosyl transferase family 2 [Paenibacillus sp. 453mf]